MNWDNRSETRVSDAAAHSPCPSQRPRWSAFRSARSIPECWRPARRGRRPRAARAGSVGHGTSQIGTDGKTSFRRAASSMQAAIGCFGGGRLIKPLRPRHNGQGRCAEGARDLKSILGDLVLGMPGDEIEPARATGGFVPAAMCVVRRRAIGAVPLRAAKSPPFARRRGRPPGASSNRLPVARAIVAAGRTNPPGPFMPAGPLGRLHAADACPRSRASAAARPASARTATEKRSGAGFAAFPPFADV